VPPDHIKLMGQLILIALATFVSEDLTCIATGALIASGMLGFLPGVLACVAGIFFGDLLLYFAGRLLGRPIVRWKPLRRILSVTMERPTADSQ
jgi:membrane protein DedA with SNARE-associated domain